MAVKWLQSLDETTTDEKKAQLAEKIIRLRVNLSLFEIISNLV